MKLNRYCKGQTVQTLSKLETECGICYPVRTRFKVLEVRMPEVSKLIPGDKPGTFHRFPGCLVLRAIQTEKPDPFKKTRTKHKNLYIDEEPPGMNFPFSVIST